MEIEGIMLSETSERKTNTVWSHLYVESKQNKINKKPQILYIATESSHVTFLMLQQRNTD